MNEHTRLLPVLELDGREFLVDIDNHQFINTDDLSHCISMYSKQGDALVNAMQDTEWRSFVVYPDEGVEV